jgi:hypothetical protein
MLDGLTRDELLAFIVEALVRLLPQTEISAKAEADIMPRLLSAEQLAERWSLPVSWIRDQTRSGKLRSHRLGHYVRIDERDAARFLVEIQLENDATSTLNLTRRHKRHIQAV